MQSISQLRRIRHPGVLKVIEVADPTKDIGFAAEEVWSTLECDSGLNSDDITYIADQLAQVIQFLHISVGLLNLSITPYSVCLTKDLQIKLSDFTFCWCAMQPAFRFNPFDISPAYPHLNFSAPEVLLDEAISPACDVFSWASVVLCCLTRRCFFDATTVEDQMRQIQTRPIPILSSEDMRELIINGLRIEPTLRPKVDDIIKSRAFLQLSIRSLRFLDAILTKSGPERHTFYSNFLPTLPLFSDRLLRYRLQPIFLNDLLRDVRYGPVLIPLIFNIGRRYDKADFMREIIVPLRKILEMTVPEELALANLSVTPIIIDRVEVNSQCDVLSPLFIASLHSSSSRLRGEALKHIPLMIASMTEDVILASLVPTLLRFIDEISDISIVCAVLEGLGQCLAKVHPDTFCEVAIPKLMLCWNRVKQPHLALAIEFVLRKLHPTSPMVCKFVIPIAAEVLASRKARPATQSQLATIINDSIDAIMSERNLVARSANWQPQVVRDPNRLILPVHVTALNLDRRQRFAEAEELLPPLAPPPRRPEMLAGSEAGRRSSGMESCFS
jgi:serine/threonine protein kinase